MSRKLDAAPAEALGHEVRKEVDKVNYKYRHVKEGLESVACTGCKYIHRGVNSEPCCLCSRAKLGSSRDYYVEREKKRLF
jgi:hypothetical protein